MSSELDDLLNVADHTEEIQRRINRLFNTMLDQAEDMMLRGSVATKTRLITTAVPAMMTYMKQEDGTQMAALKQSLDELNAVVRGELMPPSPPPPVE